MLDADRGWFGPTRGVGSLGRIGTVGGLLVVGVLVAANAYFVAAEFGLVAVDRPRVRAEAAAGRAWARRTERLLGRLSFHLSGAQLGITVVSLALGFVAEPAIAQLIEGPVESLLGASSARGVSIALALALATTLHMVLGELVPKNVAIAKPVAVTRVLGRPMLVWGALVRPVVAVLNGLANAILRRLGVEPRDELDHVRSIEELEQLIESAGQFGTLDPIEVDLLTRSIRFGERTAADALTPRVEVEALACDDTVAALVERSIATGYTRFPVYRDDLDHIEGIVGVRSALAMPPERRTITAVSAVMDPVLVVPEARELTDLFGDLRRTGNHVAVVIDEHGGTAGLVTLEDVIEELVGEISDEHDATGGAALTRVEEAGSWLVAGATNLGEVEHLSGLELPEGHYETVAGFLLARLGRIPEPGELVDVEGWRLEVVAMDRRRIATVRIRGPR